MTGRSISASAGSPIVCVKAAGDLFLGPYPFRYL
nr:hypothetical protein [Methylobacterium radiotolerans JCM 2831]